MTTNPLPAMTPDRVTAVAEEVARVIADYGHDERGIALVHLKIVRPNDKQTSVSWAAEDGE